MIDFEVSQLVPFAVVFAFICLDIISGVVKACALHELSSTRMRQGLWHKCASVLLVIAAFMLTNAANLYEFMPYDCSLIYDGISVYIVAMELVSILENVCAANPELSVAKVFELFHIDKDA